MLSERIHLLGNIKHFTGKKSKRYAQKSNKNVLRLRLTLYIDEFLAIVYVWYARYIQSWDVPTINR